ncbi:MAG: hypothetical protein AAB229_10525 [Candidatus Hydrogenedentota bacterium]|mgnify:CR=1 FL=1
MKRCFSFDESQRLLPDIMRITGRHREEMEHLWNKLNVDPRPATVLWTYHQLNLLKANWIRLIRETGALPVRLWEVSFNSGDGFHYSWRLGEAGIEYVSRFDPDHPRRPAGYFRRYPLASIIKD